MSTIPLRIILHGLIALVPQNGPDGAKMTAILVNAHNKPADMECYSDHQPAIRFQTSSRECTAVAGCDEDPKEEGFCICPLDRQEVTILPQTSGKAQPPDKKPLRSLPFDKNAASSFAYVANLSELYTLAPGVLPTDPPVAPPATVAARFKFPFDTVAVCGLVTRPDDRVDYVYAMNMRPLGALEERTEMSQAMAQRVEATVAVDVGDTEVLKLVLSPFPGQAGEAHEFKLPTDLAEVEIWLSNERVEHYMQPDKICDDGIGRDFAFFYDLVQNKPDSWAKRPVPHVKYSVAKSITDLFPPSDPHLCMGKKALMSRPICPMASF